MVVNFVVVVVVEWLGVVVFVVIVKVLELVLDVMPHQSQRAPKRPFNKNTLKLQ